MTNEQRKQIYLLRKSGLGYQAIGKAVGLSRDSVRSFCKSHKMILWRKNGQEHSRKNKRIAYKWLWL